MASSWPSPPSPEYWHHIPSPVWSEPIGVNEGSVLAGEGGATACLVATSRFREGGGRLRPTPVGCAECRRPGVSVKSFAENPEGDAVAGGVGSWSSTVSGIIFLLRVRRGTKRKTWCEGGSIRAKEGHQRTVDSKKKLLYHTTSKHTQMSCIGQIMLRYDYMCRSGPREGNHDLSMNGPYSRPKAIPHSDSPATKPWRESTFTWKKVVYRTGKYQVCWIPTRVAAMLMRHLEYRDNIDRA